MTTSIRVIRGRRALEKHAFARELVIPGSQTLRADALRNRRWAAVPIYCPVAGYVGNTADSIPESVARWLTAAQHTCFVIQLLWALGGENWPRWRFFKEKLREVRTIGASPKDLAEVSRELSVAPWLLVDETRSAVLLSTTRDHFDMAGPEEWVAENTGATPMRMLETWDSQVQDARHDREYLQTVGRHYRDALGPSI